MNLVTRPNLVQPCQKVEALGKSSPYYHYYHTSPANVRVHEEKPMSANAPSPYIQISIHVNNVHNVQYPCRGRHAPQGMYRLFFYFHTRSNLSTYRSTQPYVPPHSKSTMTPACTRTTKQCKVASPKRLISACSSRLRRSNQRCNLQDTGWCMLCSRKRWSGWEEYMRFNCGRGRRKRRRGRSLRQSRMQGKQDKVDWKMRNRFWKEVTTFPSYIDWSAWSRCTARLELDTPKFSQLPTSAHHASNVAIAGPYLDSTNSSI